MSSILEKDLITEDDIKQLITLKVEESIHLDFKKLHSYLLKNRHHYLLNYRHSYLPKNRHCYLPFTYLHKRVA